MLRPRTTLVGVALATVALVAAGCDDDGGGDEAAAPVAGDEVAVVDDAFEPPHLEVAAGETVTWAWEGSAPHDVVGDDFRSEIQTDGTFAHTFDEPGTYDYRCTVHPGMDGTVTVVDG